MIKCMCDCLLCVEEYVVKVCVYLKGVCWWRRGGDRRQGCVYVFMFQRMSFTISVDSLGYMLPNTDSSSSQGPEAELCLPDVSSCLTAGSQEPCLP